MKLSKKAKPALIALALATLLAGCGSLQPQTVSALGRAVADDAKHACGLSREDQAKISATVESAVESGAWQRPQQPTALHCEDRRQRERADGALKPNSSSAAAPASKPAPLPPRRPRMIFKGA